MTKLLFLFLIGGALFMTGCETTREISLNKDGSGTLVTTMDMSGMIGMAKMAGQGKEEMEKLEEQAIDTTVSLDRIADSLKDISTEEKALVKKGKLALQMDFKEDKFITKLEFPFSDPGQINKLDQISSKVIQDAVKKQMTAAAKDSAEAGIPGAGNMLEGSIEDYFVTTYSKGIIEKKLVKEKYDSVGSDESMKALKEMTAMGVGNSTLIINLPRPAIKAEGKNVKLSDDKKKVTITANAEDFFDDATQLEFRIEY
jgi:hypothetical protein